MKIDNVTTIFAILNDDSSGMTFTVKYFLIRVLIIYGRELPVVEVMTRLVNRLGMTEKDIKKARDWLVKACYIEPSRQKPEGKNSSRPIEGFEFNSAWLGRLFVTNHALKYPAGIKERVLELLSLEGNGKEAMEFPDNEISNKPNVSLLGQRSSKKVMVGGEEKQSRFCPQGSHDLRASNRILLAVMLLHSSQFGMVKGLGLGKLGKLAGMPPDKVKSQIKTLMKKRYIRRYISGGTSKSIFGVYPGIYFLDLNHKDFIAKGGLTTCLFGTNLQPHLTHSSEASQLLSNGINYETWGKLLFPNITIGPMLSYELTRGVPESYMEILGLFNNDQAISSYLQQYIDNLASELLSTRYDNFKNIERIDIPKVMSIDELKIVTVYKEANHEKMVTVYEEAIHEKIVNDIFIDGPEPIDNKGKEAERVRKLKVRKAAELIYLIAFERACLAKMILNKFCKLLPLDLMNFQIMPVIRLDAKGSSSFYVSILCLPKVDMNWEYSYVFVSETKEKTVPKISLEFQKLVDKPLNSELIESNGRQTEVMYLAADKREWIEEDILFKFGLLTKME